MQHKKNIFMFRITGAKLQSCRHAVVQKMSGNDIILCDFVAPALHHKTSSEMLLNIERFEQTFCCVADHNAFLKTFLCSVVTAPVSVLFDICILFELKNIFV